MRTRELVIVCYLTHAATVGVAACLYGGLDPSSCTSRQTASLRPPFASTCPAVDLVVKSIKSSQGMASNRITAPSTLRILCFGDSLTAGYSQWGMQHYPYAAHLKGPLQAACSSTNIQIDIEGMSGAQVRGQYTWRLNTACKIARDKPYDWIIIMGGTNDLGWGGQAQEIYEALSRYLLSIAP